MDVRDLVRGDAGALGFVAAGGKGAHTPAVYSGASRGLGERIPGWIARRGAAQDRLDAGGGGGRSRNAGSSRRCSSADAGMRMPCATWCGTIFWRLWPTRTRFWFSTILRQAQDEAVFLAPEKLRAACNVSIPAWPARSRTVRSACSRPTPHGTVMRSSIGPCTCLRPGARIRPAWLPPTCRGERLFRPGLALAMIERAIVAGVPFSRMSADTVYGVG